MEEFVVMPATPRASRPAARHSPSARPNGGARAPTRSADIMAVLRQFRELFRVSQQHYQRIEARCGVSGAQLWALAELARNPGLTVSGLAGLLSIHLSTSSNLLDKLEHQGFVRRSRDRADHRVVHLHVTAAGKAVLARAPRPVEGVIPDAVRRLDSRARARLHGDLARLLELATVRSPDAALKLLAEP
jgi:DNA-binding MarR family transcriptional regulator